MLFSGTAPPLFVLLKNTSERCDAASTFATLFVNSDDVTNSAENSITFGTTASNLIDAEKLVSPVEKPSYLINFLKAALAISFIER